MKSIIITLSLALLLCFNTSAAMKVGADSHSPMQYSPEQFTQEMHISRGGQLYDNWWSTTTTTEKPEGNHPLWKDRKANKRSGYSTYRCKECHGWDYRGKDGAYGKGSHYTGFIGVYEASLKMAPKELEAALRGSTNRQHDFSAYLSSDDISDIVLFLEKGVIDTGKYVNMYASPVAGSLIKGQDLYSRTCMTECHGPQGMAMNLGDKEKPVFIGTIANENPWEFIHKVRSGQPGTRMASGIIYEWNEENIRDLLAYSQTLPARKPEIKWYDRVMIQMGVGKEGPESRILEEHRGFGPKTE